MGGATACSSVVNAGVNLDYAGRRQEGLGLMLWARATPAAGGAMSDQPTSASRQRPVSALLRDHDACFAEFLRPSANGQKILQAILMRAAFRQFAEERVAIRQDAPTTILDVSCGPGDFSVAWTSAIAKFLPRGMVFYCTDIASGVARETGEKYTTATVNKMRAAAQRGNVALAEVPVGIDADLFSGSDRLVPPGQCADVIHWSHSGYYVRYALGPDKDDPDAIEAGMNIAVDKMWAALDHGGLMIAVHQTRDTSDGIPSQMLPVSRNYCPALDNVPEMIDDRARRLGGSVATVNFASPLYFAEPSEADWEVLKRPAQWQELGPLQVRNLLLLNFSASDFSDPDKAALEKLADIDRLASYVDAFRSIVTQNHGYILAKCAFQMITKSQDVALKLNAIAGQLRREMPGFRHEMVRQMDIERNGLA
jgi:hypothetical protein